MTAILGFVSTVYGQLSGELSFAELGERAPIQLTDNPTRSGQLLVALIISGQFFMGGVIGVFCRANMLKIWSAPQFWGRLNQSKWRVFKNGYSHRLMVWLLDLPPVSEKEQARN